MKLLFTLCILLSNALSYGQLFIDLDGKKFNCDSAYTNHEMSLCAGAMLDSTMKNYKMALQKLNICLDTLILEDDQYRKESLKDNPKLDFEFWTDFRLIKKMVNESNLLFDKHAKLESDIIGEFYGLGRERTIAEIMTLKQLYDERIEDFEFIMKMHCN